MRPTTRGVLAACAVLPLLSLSLIQADEPVPGRRADQAALKPYGGWIGPWRGVGQPKRQSNRGAWTETAAWTWELTRDAAALALAVDRGKYFKSARLAPAKKPGRFQLDAVLTDGSKRTFQGEAGDRDRLVLSAEGPAAEGVRRITLTPLHDTRFLMLLEAQDPANDVYYRLGEVGFTRQGVAFAAGESYPICIVTEGRGTISVTYQGKTYHVCCSGCKQLFDDDPAAIIAEAEARTKAKASP
ncbi:MAG: hypothetical protein ABI353_02525 [Isosphaeraceae bacterium]